MKDNKKGFTLVELLAVIVILAVIILIAVTAVIPRMNSAKKNALVDEALVYLKAAKEAYEFDSNLYNSSSCTSISDLNGKYVKKDSGQYEGAIKTIVSDGVISQTIYLTDGKFYVSGTDNISIDNVTDEKPAGFLNSCGDFNPILADNADTNTFAYKIIMSSGTGTFEENIAAIEGRSNSTNVDIQHGATTIESSGIFKTEDNDGASYYYRGVINNNWVEFGGFYWRIIRINGDGSVRLIYSGTSNSNHTGANANILLSTNSKETSFADLKTVTIQTKDISGLTNNNIQTTYTNGAFSHTTGGYMFNPSLVLKVAPDINLSNENKLNMFAKYTNVSNSTQYYFFKNFDMSTDCKEGNYSDNGVGCTLKCRELGNDCVYSNFNTLATTEGNYSSTAAGFYQYSNQNNNVFISPYKYTCWANGTPTTVNNSDGTTSVYISCPIVSEVLGNVVGSPTNAWVKSYGLYSQSASVAASNVLDSNAKKEVDRWYENNIYNIKDTSNVNYLEDYLSDEMYCNDRTLDEPYYPYGISEKNDLYTYTLMYAPGIRLNSQVPSLKCRNSSRDGFTLTSDTTSRVQSRNIGNRKLKYPVGMITADEVSYSGGIHFSANSNYYLYTGAKYFTITPAFYYSTNQYMSMYYVNGSGSLTSIYNYGTNTGLRPVINLKPSVLYDSGSGIEADPYKVKLPTT